MWVLFGVSRYGSNYEGTLSGEATRSYLYVEDVAEAFDVILHRGSVGQTYNIGTQKERTVAEVAADIAKHFALPEKKITHVRDRAFNDRRQALHSMCLLITKLCAQCFPPSIIFVDSLSLVSRVSVRNSCSMLRYPPPPPRRPIPKAWSLLLKEPISLFEASEERFAAKWGGQLS
jgi:hypothetical protein